MSEKSLLIVNARVNPEHPEALKNYTEKATPLFKQAGGQPVGRYKVDEQILGEYTPDIVVVMEFPDNDSIKRVFDSEPYKALIPDREKAFHSLEIFIGKA